MTRPDPTQMKEALEGPSRADDAAMHFGAKPEEAAPPGSADAAVKRAAAGWAGRREGEDHPPSHPTTKEAAMAEKREDGLSPKVPTERPDPAAASREPRPGAIDRPGFDLGGAKRAPGHAGNPEIRDDGSREPPPDAGGDRVRERGD